MSTHTSTHQSATGRQSLMTMLLSNPRVIAAPGTRAVVTGIIVVGALLTAASGVIHLYLWGQDNGYRQIPTIGPLFLAQGIGAILLALVLLGTRWLAAVVAAAGMLIATAIGLLISIEVGMFGFQETWYAPWARTSFAEELAGGVLLLFAALADGQAAPGKLSRSESALAEPAGQLASPADGAQPPFGLLANRRRCDDKKPVGGAQGRRGLRHESAPSRPASSAASEAAVSASR